MKLSVSLSSTTLFTVLLVWCSAAQSQDWRDFRCTISAVISAPKLPAAQQAFLNSTYVGREFTVERQSGQMAGALKVLSPVAPQIIDRGDKDNGFKMVATMRREQGAGSGTAIYSLAINTFDAAPEKPFLFTNNATAYIGTCLLF